MSGWMRIGLILSLFAFACAAPQPRPNIAPAVEIDLSPRCFSLEAETSSPEPWVLSSPERIFLRTRLDGEGGEQSGPQIWVLETPYAARETLSWGFPITNVPAALARVLLEEGSTTRAPETFRARVSSVGGRVAVHEIDDWVWLELDYPAAERRGAFDVFREWLEIAPIDPTTFAQTRRRVSIESLAARSLPSVVAEEAFDHLQRGVPSTPIEDTPSRVRHADQLEAALRTALRIESSVVLFSGASDPDAREAIASHIAVIASERAAPTAIPRVPAEPRAETLFESLGNDPREIHVVDRPGSIQVEILIGLPSVGPDHADSPALEALASLLGRDVGGRLFRDLRERQGLAYIINAFQRPEARFVVTTRARPERVVPLVRGIEVHLRALATLPLETCEVEMIEARMLGEEALARDDATLLRQRFREDIARNLQPTSPSERGQRYASAINKGLDPVARRHLSDNPIVVLVGDADQLRADFGAAMPERAVRVFAEDLRSIR